MTKYKIGDKVKIVKEWKKGCCQNSKGGMDKYLGTVMTISKIEKIYGGEICYRMKEDEGEHLGGWYWYEPAIAGLADNYKIVITTNGTETLARLYEGKKVVKSATVKCSPEDEFNFETGARIAFDRLMGEKTEEKPKYYNGKVVCVEKDSDIRAYTVGKVYEFKDGRVEIDNHCYYPLGKGITTLDEWNDDPHLYCKFIPFVE